MPYVPNKICEANRLNRQSGIAKTALVTVLVLCLGAASAALWYLLQPQSPADVLQKQAERYVKLATAFGAHRADEVDIYFGPSSLDSRTARNVSSLPELLLEAQDLSNQLTANTTDSVDPIDSTDIATRRSLLVEHVETLIKLFESTQVSQKWTFNQELSLLYGLQIEPVDLSVVQDSLDKLEELLPGRGTLAFRVAAFRNRLLVPADKRKIVFEAALAECKARTLQHWTLPPEEQLSLEWSREVQAAWHDYKGQGQSVLTLNDLSIAYIDSAADVACHEAYPGHHTQYVLQEFAEGQVGLAVENSITLLRSPKSILLEGAAMAGVDMVFSVEEKQAFERETLAPLAGISLPDAQQILEFTQLIDIIGTAALPILQEYYDGLIAYNTATFRLEREALITSPSALLEFVNQFGTYSVGYNLAETRLIKYLNASGAESADERWAAMQDIIAAPASNAPKVFSEFLSD